MASPIEGEKAPKAAISAASQKAWSTDLKFGRYKAAIAALDAALSAKDLDDEQRAIALINRGLALQQLKKYKQAVRDYSAAMKFDALAAKTRATVIYNRGIAYHKLKRAALAIE
ncbi:MAG: tetratricopeptide repeat protein, partial [Pseudomonadota bacterium]